MRKKVHLYLLLFFFWAIGPVSFAQSPLFKFGVTKSGVYKITESNARQLGFQNLSEVTFFGYPGMLPQKLDSAQLSHQEISSWQSGNALFVYLEGPTRGHGHRRHRRRSGLSLARPVRADDRVAAFGRKRQAARVQANEVGHQLV